MTGPIETGFAVGVNDPQQGLETRNSAGIEIDNRLVVHGRALQHPQEILVHISPAACATQKHDYTRLRIDLSSTRQASLKDFSGSALSP